MRRAPLIPIAFIILMVVPVAPSFGAQGSMDFYLKACKDTGYEAGICTCLAKAYSSAKGVNADAVSALMQDFILTGNLNPALADAKRDMVMQKITISDPDLQKAITVAKTGAKCTQ